MHRLICILSITLAIISLSSCCQGKGEFGYLLKGLPFEMESIERPDIPGNSVDLTEFGGNGNGIFLNTEAFASAIERLESLGGGRLNVPAGIWKTGPIRLKSNIELHLEYGAVVLFDSNPDLYPIIRTVFEGLDTYRCEAPLSAEGAHDIAITGSGVFDGNGQDWRPLKKGKVPASQWKKKVASGGVVNEKGDCWYPDEAYLTTEATANMNVPADGIDPETIKRFLRPQMV